MTLSACCYFSNVQSQDGGPSCVGQLQQIKGRQPSCLSLYQSCVTLMTIKTEIQIIQQVCTSTVYLDFLCFESSFSINHRITCLQIEKENAHNTLSDSIWQRKTEPIHELVVTSITVPSYIFKHCPLIFLLNILLNIVQLVGRKNNLDTVKK